MIRVVLWDIDGTLTDFKAAEDLGIRNCFKKFHLGRCSKEKIAKYSKINTEYWHMLERGEITKPELLVKRFDDFFALYDLKCDSAAFNEAYQEELRENVLINKGAMEAVDKLREMGIVQYVVTNGIVQSQYRKLEKIGMKDKFLNVFISDDIGYDKPAKEFFEQVFAEIKKVYPDVKKDEIMIIGDSETSDMQGGINVGIKTCWYNPEHAEAKNRYDNETDDLNKIPEIVEEYKMEENETKTEAVTEEKKEVTEEVTEEKKEVSEPVKIVTEPKKKTLKDIVDNNYRAIIVCLAAIALLFVCLFVGTSSRKNTYELSELTGLETSAKMTLPSKWYLADSGYGYYVAYKEDGKYVVPVMSVAGIDGYSEEDIVAMVEELETEYETANGTYAGNNAYFIKNINNDEDEEDICDYIFLIMSDGNILNFQFIGVDESTEISVLNGIK